MEYSILGNGAFYERIDKTLIKRGMSRRELASRIGVAPSTLQSMFENKTDMKMSIYSKISRVLNSEETVKEGRSVEEKKAEIGVLSKEQKETLTKACYDFTLRVLEGKRATPQETATLPEVLNFLRASNAGPYSNFGSSAGSE